MEQVAYYPSPIGWLRLAAGREGLAGVWPVAEEGQDGNGTGEILARTADWLGRYFSGREPGELPPLQMQGTPYQREVWKLLLEIPYGTTVTYGELARRLTLRRGAPGTSARAVGGAVGRNRLAILVPCHRVVGADGSLTGYAWGTEKKAALLAHEGIRLG